MFRGRKRVKKVDEEVDFGSDDRLGDFGLRMVSDGR